MPAGGSNKLLNLTDAAACLAVPERRLRDNWKRWGVRTIKVGRELRFRERDLEAFIERNVEAA